LKLSDESTMIRVIKQYYEQGISQEDIAKKDYISKSTVSRLIKKAEEKGYVRVVLDYPVVSRSELEAKIDAAFPGVRSSIVPAYVDDYELRLKDACRALLTDFLRLVQDDDIVAVSWGRTIEFLANMLVDYQTSKKGVKIVQSNGFVAGELSTMRSSQILQKFEDFFGAKAYMMPVPVVVDKAETAHALMQDSILKPVLDLARKARFCIFTVGHYAEDSVLFQRRLVAKKDFDLLLKAGAEGDMCSRYFDINGNIADTGLDARTLGLSMKDISEKQYRMVVAVGKKKVKAIIGALRTGAVNRFYTDELTAKDILVALNEKV